jgi:hypothetical protein
MIYSMIHVYVSRGLLGGGRHYQMIPLTYCTLPIIDSCCDYVILGDCTKEQMGGTMVYSQPRSSLMSLLQYARYESYHSSCMNRKPSNVRRQRRIKEEKERKRRAGNISDDDEEELDDGKRSSLGSLRPPTAPAGKKGAIATSAIAAAQQTRHEEEKVDDDDDDDDDGDDEEYIPRDEYIRIHVKMQKAVDKHFDTEDGIRRSHSDWERDTRSQESSHLGIGKRLFFHALFEIADIWTTTLEVAEYVAFLTNLFMRISRKVFVPVTPIPPPVTVVTVPPVIIEPSPPPPRSPDTPEDTHAFPALSSLIRASPEPRSPSPPAKKQAPPAKKEVDLGEKDNNYEEVYFPSLGTPKKAEPAWKVITVWKELSDIKVMNTSDPVVHEAIVRDPLVIDFCTTSFLPTALGSSLLMCCIKQFRAAHEFPMYEARGSRSQLAPWQTIGTDDNKLLTAALGPTAEEKKAAAAAKREKEAAEAKAEREARKKRKWERKTAKDRVRRDRKIVGSGKRVNRPGRPAKVRTKSEVPPSVIAAETLPYVCLSYPHPNLLPQS